jgi:hypothetical protein
MALTSVIACANPDALPTEDALSHDTLSAVPTLELTGTQPNGDATFFSPVGATRLSDGTVAIGDLHGQAVWFFTSDGGVQKVGRRGSGPGEFVQVSWLSQCARDTVFVWDRFSNRMTVVDAAGSITRQYRIPAEPSVPPPALVHCGRGGHFVLLGLPDAPFQIDSKTGESPYYRAPLFRGDAHGGMTRLIDAIGAGEMRPLGRVTSIAVGQDRFFVGTKDSAWVDVYDLEGQLIERLPVQVAARRPTRQHYERAIDEQVAGLRIPSERQQMKEILLAMPMPEHLPIYGPLFTDPDGILWVTVSAPGDSVTRVQAVNRQPRREIAIPAVLKLFEIGRDYVLATYEDSIGEPRVVLYGFQ